MQNRLIWIDAVRFIAIFTVVILHTAAPLLSQYTQIPIINWHVANLYNSAVRMGVPLFFMISGFLLLRNYDEDTKVFFTKRIHKVIIPMLAWSLIYILFIKYVQEKDINVIKRMIVALNMYTYYHLWFLYTLLGLYLITPFLRIIVKHASDKLLYYFLGLWLIHISIIPLINKFAHVAFESHLALMSDALGYFIFGYVLSKFSYSKKMFYGALLIFILSSIAVAGITFILTEQAGSFDKTFYGSQGGLGIVQSISTFILIKYWFNDRKVPLKESTSKFIKYFSVTSFGIYLVHPIIITVLEKAYLGFSASVNNGNTALMIPLVSILTLLLSSIVIYMMQKIPYIKKIVP